jgi:hypothetical protein
LREICERGKKEMMSNHKPYKIGTMLYDNISPALGQIVESCISPETGRVRYKVYWFSKSIWNIRMDEADYLEDLRSEYRRLEGEVKEDKDQSRI